MKTRSSLLPVFTLIITGIVIFPFVWMVFLSFKTDTEIMNAPFAIPDALTFVNYSRALDTLPLLVMYKNTFVIVVFSVTIGVTITFMSSFALARLRFRSETMRSGIYLFILGGLMIPTYVLLFPI